MFAWGQGRGELGVIASGYGISFGGDGNVLELVAMAEPPSM